MLISAPRLATEIATRLARIVPPPFSVSVADSDLRIEHPAGWGMIMGFDWIEDPSEDRSAAELAELMIDNALNSLQDAISEATKEPWPPLASDGHLRVMAPYGTRFDGERIFFWYGVTERQPVIAFAPIALHDVVQPTD